MQRVAAPVDLKGVPMTIYYVMNENTLGYVQPHQPDVFGILHGSVLKGGLDDKQGFITILPGSDKLRLATLADFEEYRVHPGGFLRSKVYSIDLPVTVTAYIRADSEEEARKILRDEYLTPGGGEVATADGTRSDNSILISGARFDSEHLPPISISPAITFTMAAEQELEVELVEDNSSPAPEMD